MTQIANNWITLSEQRNGVTVERKFAGLDAFVNEQDEVIYCYVKYWERELYPNGSVIKTELKKYSLEDLSETVNDVEGWRMEPRAVLTGFIQSLGDPYIIGPARDTLETVTTLPLNVPEGYPLHLDTRPKISI